MLGILNIFNSGISKKGLQKSQNNKATAVLNNGQNVQKNVKYGTS